MNFAVCFLAKLLAPLLRARSPVLVRAPTCQASGLKNPIRKESNQGRWDGRNMGSTFVVCVCMRLTKIVDRNTRLPRISCTKRLPGALDF